MSAFLVVVLRVIGLIWAIGAVFIMRNAREAGDSDAARWAFAGGVLTFVAGIFLLAGSRWAAVPAVLVAAQQILFYLRQRRTLPPGSVPARPVHLQVAVVVAAATLLAVWKGLLI